MTRQGNGVDQPMVQRSENKPAQSAMGAGERQSWGALSRAADLREVLDQLNTPELFGVALIGPRGAGKTSLGCRIQQELATSRHVVRLFANYGMNQDPFSIFTIHLARLPEPLPERSEQLVDALVEMLSTDAGGRQALFILDGLPGIDVWSTAVLMRMILGGGARLLVMAHSPAELPADLAWLLKDGLLAQHRMGLLTHSDSATLLERVLHAPVAGSVLFTLQAMSDGNPLVLHALVNEFKEHKTLRMHDGTWMLFGPHDVDPDGFLSEMVASWLAHESHAVRQGLEIAALLQEFSLPLAISALGAEVVTALERLGYLSLSPGHRDRLAFTDSFVAPAIRIRIPARRKQALLAGLPSKGAIDPTAMTEKEILAMAQWRAGAQQPLLPEEGLAAAQAALKLLEPEMALSFCTSIPHNHPLSVGGAQARSQAHYILGDYKAAVAELLAINQEDVAALDADAYASWAADLARSLMWLPGGHARVDKLLEEAAGRLEMLAPGGGGHARQLLQLASHENAVHQGKFVQVAQELEDVWHGREDLEHRLECACLLAMAMAATGRENEAVELSGLVERALEKHGLVLRMQGWHFRGRILALGWSGRWRQCEEELDGLMAQSQGMARQYGSVIELTLGLAYLHAQRSALAVKMLRKAAAQLEVRNTNHGRELAYAALAYACADVNEPGQSKKYLALMAQEDAAMDWASRSLADLFRLQALAAADDPAAVGLLAREAEAELAAGRFTSAATSAFAAVANVGSATHYELLARAAGKCQGPAASIRVLLARAAATGDAGFALEAARTAGAQGLSEIELFSASAALGWAKAAGQQRLVHAARQRVEELSPRQPGLRHKTADPLTPREKQVAEFALRGMSNRQIATQIDVSVRTVEGHLYQVFAKLNIDSRAELQMGAAP